MILPVLNKLDEAKDLIEQAETDTLFGENYARLLYEDFNNMRNNNNKPIKANILIVDKVQGTVERFEPYRTTNYVENEKFDELLEDRLVPILEKELKKKIKYYSPKDLMGGVSFQILSNDSDPTVKKMGDPVGYCLAWTYWYLEMRIANPDMSPPKLIKTSMNKIIKGNTTKGKFVFICMHCYLIDSNCWSTCL